MLYLLLFNFLFWKISNIPKSRDNRIINLGFNNYSLFPNFVSHMHASQFWTTWDVLKLIPAVASFYSHMLQYVQTYFMYIYIYK